MYPSIKQSKASNKLADQIPLGHTHTNVYIYIYAKDLAHEAQFFYA